MKFGRLILANLLRKKTRLVLTLGSFAVALFLFALLAVLREAFNGGADMAGVDRIVVINRTSLIQPLPISYRERMMRIAGVKRITFDNWFGGVYQDERNFFPQFAIDVDNQRQVFSELIVPGDQWQVFVKDRQGAIAGAALARRFGWKIGDRVPIRGTIFPGTWEFNIDGIYHGRRPQDDEGQFWFQRDYLEENGPPGLKGLIGWYTVQVDNPDDSVRIAKAIDEEFANSPYETHTETEKAFATDFVKQAGNIELLILTIGSVVFFTLLLVTGNTMAIAVRERTAELAVLKAVGFSDRFVLLLVIAESLVLALVGGGLGLLLAKMTAGLLGKALQGGFVSAAYLDWSSVTSGLVLALLVGIASGILPAVSAMRLRVVQALRRV